MRKNCYINMGMNCPNNQCSANQTNSKCCSNMIENDPINANCCQNSNNECNCNMMNDNNYCPNMTLRNSCCGNTMNNNNCGNMQQKMLEELQAYDFAIEELALYLDTHPDDMRAVCMHNQYAKKYRKLSDEYQMLYGPLTIMYPCNSWRWLEEPWPWQKTNNNMNREIKEDCDYELKGGVE